MLFATGFVTETSRSCLHCLSRLFGEVAVGVECGVDLKCYCPRKTMKKTAESVLAQLGCDLKAS